MFVYYKKLGSALQTDSENLSLLRSTRLHIVYCLLFTQTRSQDFHELKVIDNQNCSRRDDDTFHLHVGSTTNKIYSLFVRLLVQTHHVHSI